MSPFLVLIIFKGKKTTKLGKSWEFVYNRGLLDMTLSNSSRGVVFA